MPSRNPQSISIEELKSAVNKQVQSAIQTSVAPQDFRLNPLPGPIIIGLILDLDRLGNMTPAKLEGLAGDILKSAGLPEELDAAVGISGGKATIGFIPPHDLIGLG